jgi:hypothetical protein
MQQREYVVKTPNLAGGGVVVEAGGEAAGPSNSKRHGAPDWSKILFCAKASSGAAAKQVSIHRLIFAGVVVEAAEDY